MQIKRKIADPLMTGLQARQRERERERKRDEAATAAVDCRDLGFAR